jgi:sugar O-acyltransferase (sialic acid O-acetyltransferase NeuD family)
VGAGGHGREMLDVVEAINRVSPRYSFLGFLDDNVQSSDLVARRNAAVIGNVKQLKAIDADYVIGIGLPALRRRIDEYATSVGRTAAVLVHPSATLASELRLGPGTVIAAGAHLTTNIRLGRHVHLNIKSSLSHDCVVGDYVTLNPSATISGNVSLEDEVTVGAGAVVIQGLSVGCSSFVGAGAVVIDDLPPNVKAVGVPARPTQRRSNDS